MAKKGVFGPKRQFLHPKKKRPKGQKTFFSQTYVFATFSHISAKRAKKIKKYGQKRRFLLKKGHCDKKKEKKKSLEAQRGHSKSIKWLQFNFK